MFSDIGIFVVIIRWPDVLIKGIHVLVRQHLYLETYPWDYLGPCLIPDLRSRWGVFYIFPSYVFALHGPRQWPLTGDPPAAALSRDPSDTKVLIPKLVSPDRQVFSVGLVGSIYGHGIANKKVIQPVFSFPMLYLFIKYCSFPHIFCTIPPFIFWNLLIVSIYNILYLIIPDNSILHPLCYYDCDEYDTVVKCKQKVSLMWSAILFGYKITLICH